MPDRLAPGTLLVAPPTLGDPNFRRTVVLLCEHDDTQGSFGLTLGRPLEDATLGDVLDLGSTAARLGGDGHPLALGGPVQPDTLHFLHRHPDAVPDTVPDAVEVLDGVFWGGDFEKVKALLASGAADAQSLRFFLGYAGWGPGQLQAERDRDGWILARATPGIVFPESLEDFWRRLMREMGGEYALLSNFPDNPRMN